MGQIPPLRLEQVQLVPGQSLGLVMRLPLRPGQPFAPDARQGVREVLRSLLASLTSSSPAALRFGKSTEGKPCLLGGGPAFNLSHSRGHSLIALSLSGDIGCDIEDRFTDEDVSGLCPLILHPLEMQAMDRFPAGDRQDAFRRYWVRKEAVLKAAGSGFLREPRHVITGLEDRLPTWAGAHGPAFVIHNQQIDAGCLAAVASMDATCTWFLLDG